MYENTKKKKWRKWWTLDSFFKNQDEIKRKPRSKRIFIYEKLLRPMLYLDVLVESGKKKKEDDDDDHFWINASRNLKLCIRINNFFHYYYEMFIVISMIILLFIFIWLFCRVSSTTIKIYFFLLLSSFVILSCDPRIGTANEIL